MNFMKKLLSICAVCVLIFGKYPGVNALKPSPDNYYSSGVEFLKTPEDIKSKCSQKYSLTVFVTCEGSDYTALGKIFDARSYKFNHKSQSECYIKKNYNNFSEILVMDEKNARDFFGNFRQAPFIKNFEIYFVSDKDGTCIESMKNMKSFIEENVRPNYQFAKIGMLKYEIPKFKEESKILILPRKVYPKHVCKRPSPLRQMRSFEKIYIEDLN